MQIATGANLRQGDDRQDLLRQTGGHFYRPQKGAVRYSLLPDFIDAMGKFEFFVYRKKGV